MDTNISNNNITDNFYHIDNSITNRYSPDNYNTDYNNTDN